MEGKKKDDWMRLASKSRPGRFYMLNKATGETQWLPLKEDGEAKQESPPKISINKTGKTPAQDRLKRLQQKLKINQTASCSIKKSDLEEKTKGEYKDQLKVASHKVKVKQERENLLKDVPSTSAAAEVCQKSPKRTAKRSHTNSPTKEIVSSSQYIGEPSDAKKMRSSHSLKCVTIKSTSNQSMIKEMEKGCKSFGENMEEKNSSCKFNDIRTGIVKKIKEVCKMPFNVSKKRAAEKLNANANKSLSIILTTQFEPTKKSMHNKRNVSSFAVQEVVKKIKDENQNTDSITTSSNKSEVSTPRNLDIPTYPRGSANSRLERLKLRLKYDQQLSSKTINDFPTNKLIPSLSSEKNIITKVSDLENNHHTSLNESINNINHTTISDEVEAMDWQPIITKDEDLIEAPRSDNLLVIEKSKKLILTTIDMNENQTMGDIYDTVNENLLRFSAEKQKDSTGYKIWHKNFYYFVVDTNVLLKDLAFMEDLTKMKLCDTQGSMLYIPYAVLQELDRLKMRSGLQEGVKIRAVRAIKYLNSKFEDNSLHVRAQTASDERHHLVDVNSADDSILNCCLQAKEHIPNLLLLTEDVNLRNKAICNNIMVSTKSDLISKRYSDDKADYKS